MYTIQVQSVGTGYCHLSFPVSRKGKTTPAAALAETTPEAVGCFDWCHPLWRKKTTLHAPGGIMTKTIGCVLHLYMHGCLSVVLYTNCVQQPDTHDSSYILNLGGINILVEVSVTARVVSFIRACDVCSFTGILSFLSSTRSHTCCRSWSCSHIAPYNYKFKLWCK